MLTLQCGMSLPAVHSVLSMRADRLTHALHETTRKLHVFAEVLACNRAMRRAVQVDVRD